MGCGVMLWGGGGGGLYGPKPKDLNGLNDENHLIYKMFNFIAFV